MSENNHSKIDKTSDCNDLSKHEKILMTSLDHFSKYGYANVSTDAIAKDAGVSKGLIFHHFNSKDDLAFEVFRNILSVDAGFDLFLEYFQNSNENIEYNEALKLIRKFIKQTLSDMEQNPGLSLLFMDLLVNLKNQSIKNKIKLLLEEYLSQLVNLFMKLGIENPEAKARTVFAIIDGLGFQFYFMDENKSKITTDDFINEIMKILEK